MRSKRQRFILKGFFYIHKNKSKGFTLIEVIIALGIMASVMMLLTSGWRGNYNRMNKIKFRTQAAQLLQLKMSEIESLYKNNPQRLPREKQTGEFEEPEFKNYKWELESQSFKLPDLKNLLSLGEQSDQLTQSLASQIQQHFEATIFEVKVTLIYKSPVAKRPLKTSVSTLFVDYTRPLQLGIPPL